jgi:hypothetical protein
MFTACSGGSASSTLRDSASPPAPSFAATADIRFEQAARAVRLDSRFAGLGYEKDKLVVPLFSPANTRLIQLYRLLGPSVLRIGANQVDRSSWNGTQAGLTPILPAQVDAFANFLRETQWRVIYGINMARNSPAEAAREAAYVAARLGSSLLAWEIGNEPDLYRSHGYRPDTWSYADFLQEWRSYRDAITAAAPGFAFSGPATAFDLPGMLLPFTRDEGAQVPMLTHHYYRGDGRDPASTMDLLLQADPKLQPELDRLVSAAADAGMTQGMRYNEANSFYNFGAPQVSNAFGSAFWMIDFLFTCAIAGCTGVNMECGGDGPGYTPLADRDGVIVETRPEFYGLLMFSRAGPGRPLPASVATRDTANLRAWGVVRDDGGFNALLINKDERAGVMVTAKTPAGAEQFDPLWLRAPSLLSTSGQTLGGVGIGQDGSWTPEPLPPLVSRDGRLEVRMPPTSAVLLRSL